MVNENPDNGWQEYKIHVMSELDDLKKLLSNMDERISDIRQIDVPSLRVEIAMLKIKSGIWGAIAGIIPVGIYFLYNHLGQK